MSDSGFTAPHGAGKADAAPAAPALCVEHLSKTFVPLTYLGIGRAAARRRAVRALRDISFSVQEGEMVGLLGPNGAGKTTLLKIMTTLMHPTEGCVRLMGHDIRENPRWTRRMMGLITCDERSFYWRLSGRHNLRFFATLYGVPEHDAEARIDELLATLDLADAAERPYHSYSSGMKQKLAIARGFIADPRMLFYDEPTRSLDPVSARRMREWIRDQRRRAPRQTHIIATNNLHEAEQLCDRVLVIDHGQLVDQGSIPELRERWQARDSVVYSVVVRGWRPVAAWKTGIESGLLDITEARSGEAVTIRFRVVRDSAALSSVLKSVIDAGGAVVSCHSEHDSFDNAFFSMLDAAHDSARYPSQARSAA